MSERRGQGRKLGRPPSPPGTARNHRVVAFVNDGEYARLQAISERLDIPLSTTVYRLLSEQLSVETTADSKRTHGKKR